MPGRAGRGVGLCGRQRRAVPNYIFVVREHSRSGTWRTIIDPTHTGNVGRFANHSCDPNLAVHLVRVASLVPRIALFASRDVPALAELTISYGDSGAGGDCGVTIGGEGNDGGGGTGSGDGDGGGTGGGGRGRAGCGGDGRGATGEGGDEGDDRPGGVGEAEGGGGEGEGGEGCGECVFGRRSSGGWGAHVRHAARRLKCEARVPQKRAVYSGSGS